METAKGHPEVVVTHSLTHSQGRDKAAMGTCTAKVM